MDAVLLAGGGVDPQDPIYPYTNGHPKAFLNIGGKPMLQWVLDALEMAPSVDRIVLVGLDALENLQAEKIVRTLPGQGGLLPNVLAGLREVMRLNPQAEYTLLVAGDIPGITAEMVEWVIAQALEGEPFDLAYVAIPREVMEARFPEARRTYLRLKDMEACGGDVHVVRTSLADTHTEIWERLIAARKHPFRQAQILGLDLVLRLLFHRLTLAEALDKVSRRLQVRGKLLLSPYAELGMDVDKPHQVELMHRVLSERQATQGGGNGALA